MYLLYLDDSGSVSNPQDKHIVLAGLAIFERQIHWLSQKLDTIAQRIWPDNPQELEFRGADMLSGKKHWRGVGRQDRFDAYKDALSAIATEARRTPLFAACVKKAYVSPEDSMEVAFEHVCNRFDRYLGRLHKQENTQRGLIILDESSYETSLQGLARNFRTIGHRWGQLYNLAEVPLFVDSKATRLIQCADLIAHAVRRFYEKGETDLMATLEGAFDNEGGVTHGLVHLTDESCSCISCRQSRRDRTGYQTTSR